MRERNQERKRSGELESWNEQGTRRILKLIESLRRLQEALEIEDPHARDKETLRNVTSLISDIEASSEWLVGKPRERAREMVEVLTPLSVYSRIYESLTSTLRCIEKSSEILGEITRKDETVYELDELYKKFRTSLNSFADKSLIRSPFLSQNGKSKLPNLFAC